MTRARARLVTVVVLCVFGVTLSAFYLLKFSLGGGRRK